MDIRTAKLKAMDGFEHMQQHRRYRGDLPDELAPWHVWVQDSGHCLLVIPEALAGEITDPQKRWEYLAAAPVRAVVAAGYRVDGDGYAYTSLTYTPLIGFSSGEDMEDFGTEEDIDRDAQLAEWFGDDDEFDDDDL